MSAARDNAAVGGGAADGRASLPRLWLHVLGLLPPRALHVLQGSYLTESVHDIVLQKSIPVQFCQLILYYYLYEE